MAQQGRHYTCPCLGLEGSCVQNSQSGVQAQDELQQTLSLCPAHHKIVLDPVHISQGAHNAEKAEKDVFH